MLHLWLMDGDSRVPGRPAFPLRVCRGHSFTRGSTSRGEQARAVPFQCILDLPCCGKLFLSRGNSRVHHVARRGEKVTKDAGFC